MHERVSPDLLARLQAVVALMREVPPSQRIYCFNPEEAGDCGQYLGRRLDFRQDLTHQWQACGGCQQNVCMACGRSQPVVEQQEQTQPCVPTAGMVDVEEMRNSPERGSWFQFCPRCDRWHIMQDGCNELVCPPCGCHFCCLCGVEAPADHWLPGYGCPRWKSKNDPRARFDYSWEHPDLLGARHLPTLALGDSPWLDSANLVKDLEKGVRVHRRLQIGGDEDARIKIRKFLLVARQLFVLMHNRHCIEKYKGFNHVRDPDDIHERLIFNHFALTYNDGLAELVKNDWLQHLPNDQPAGAAARPIKWFELYHHVRILKWRELAEQTYYTDTDERIWEDFWVLRTLLTKLLAKYTISAAMDALDAESGEQGDVRVEMDTREIGLIIRRLVNLIMSNSFGSI